MVKIPHEVILHNIHTVNENYEYDSCIIELFGFDERSNKYTMRGSLREFIDINNTNGKLIYNESSGVARIYLELENNSIININNVKIEPIFQHTTRIDDIRSDIILDEIELQNNITNKRKQKYPDMTCAFCKNEIDSPEHLEDHLGPRQTKKYMEYCKEVKTEPQLYCCDCFETIEENPKFFEVYNDMLKQYKLWRKGCDKLKEKLK